MVKVQDAPSVAHDMCSSVYRALEQGAYLCFCRVSTAQDVPKDPLSFIHVFALTCAQKQDRG